MAEISDKARICTNLFIMVLLILFLLPVTSMAAEEEGQQETVIFSIGQESYSIGGQEIKADVAPYIKDGRTMVPVALVAEALGAEKIQWNPSERKVIIQKDDKTVCIKIDSKELSVNNDNMTMDVAAEIRNVGNGGGRTMLPISFVAKAFEIGYKWDSKARSVSIYKYNKVFDQAGVFGPESDNLIIRGNATVKSDKVTLQNMTILGNLIVDKEVGTGTVFLKNLNVMGDTLIRGGGKHSIHIIGGAYHTIIVQDSGDGVLRVVAANVDGLEVVIAEAMSGEGVILEGNFQNVRVEGNDVNVQTQGNTYVNNFTVAPGINGTVISLGNGTTVEKMALESETSVRGNGKIQNIVGNDMMLKPPITPPSSGGSSSDSSLPIQVTFADIGYKNAGQVFDISGYISDLKRRNGQTVADRAYAVKVSSSLNGDLFGPFDIEFVNGRPAAAVEIQISNAGEHTLTLNVDGAQDTATVQILPGAASKLQLDGSGTVKAGELTGFTAQTQDSYGNPVVINNDLIDIITVTANKGLLTPAAVSILKNESQVGFTWSCTQAGLYTLTAAADGLTSSVYEITVEPAAVSEVLIDRDHIDSLMAGEQLEFYASAYDQYGNVITFDADDFSWAGAVTGTFSEDTAGTYAVYAEYNGIRSVSETVAVIAGQENSVSLTGLPHQWAAGESIDLLDPESGCSIELQDRYGNAVADGEYPVTISSDREELPLFGPGPVQFTAGHSGLPGPGGNTIIIPIRLTAAGEHIITIQAGEAQDTVTVQVNPGPAYQFVFREENASVIAGEEAALTLEIRDEYGNPTDVHDGFHNVISASGGTISPETVNIDSEKSQTGFTFASDTANIYYIAADSSPIVSAIYSITVNPAAPAAVNVESFTGQQEAGKDFDLVMTSLQDGYGNTLLDGTYHLEIISDREGSVFDGNVDFNDGARDQTIKLNVLEDHQLSVWVNGILVAGNISVEVMKHEVNNVIINQGELLTIKMEETAELNATIDPANATYPEIIWSSSDPSIAKVSADGVVTGMSKGSAVITATSADSGIADTIAIEVDYPDISGKGTWEEPFIIYTFAGLEKIGTGKYVSYKTTLGPIYYQLGADINADPTKDPGYNEGKGWKPITALRMQLDGKGHKISNLTINRPGEDNIGLFAIAETSRISNLELENADIIGDEYVGGIAGRLKNTNLYNDSVTGSVKGSWFAGGLAGSAYSLFGAGYSYLSECYYTGNVSASSHYAGGLVGITSELYEIQNSYSNASVSVGYEDAGGLVGYVSRYGKITNCYASGPVSSAWSYASNIGGLIGCLSTDNTKIVNSYYDKETSGRNDTGKGLPRTTVQMKAGTNSSTVDGDTMYVNWSTGLYPGYSDDVWDFGTDTEYPVLKKN